MKVNVIRVERVERSGTSKGGNPYTLDFTSVYVQIPIDDSNAFGYKETDYQYGKASDFTKLESLRGRLPLECDVELGVGLDSYGNAKTIITDIKVPSANTAKAG